ncbi:MAG: hypothetical protein M1828_002555 [Chrysothrix sp. TS-e1954]|nr:MAG: hypothetical protein M1828_002555 [Chrysothrix sp. TS-e1954]
MRMRKLGRGQSVVFFASGEITERIMNNCGKTDACDIKVMDVLLWSIRETMSEVKRYIPLWITQKVRHSKQQLITESINDEMIPSEVAEQLLEPEAQPIERRYGIASDIDPEENLSSDERMKLEEFGISRTQYVTYDEEQERELSPEVEQEREVQRPPCKTPAIHSVHADLRVLVETGQFKKHSEAFKRAFQVLHSTSAKQMYPAEIDEENLWVTRDFCDTVRLTEVAPLADDYLRPVNWVLRCTVQSGKEDLCIILSPYEAHELLPDILTSKYVNLPIYSPRTSAIAPSLEHLTYCNVKESMQPISERVSHFLSLFSGQLYLANYERYITLCRAIGLFNPSAAGCTKAATDGFIDLDARAAFDSTWADECWFVKSPVDFFGSILTMRRKGLDFRRSHLGRVLAGETLREEGFSDDHQS